MDYIRVAKVPDVTLVVGKASHQGTLHLLSHHILFCPSNGEPEIWISYSSIHTVNRKYSDVNGNHPLFIMCQTFLLAKLFIPKEQDAADVYSSLQKLMNVASVDQLYAFFYKPLHPFPMAVGWTIYDPKQDYGRMGVGTKTNNWRISAINQDFQFAPTYPRYLVVPSRISDHTLKHIGKFRSKSRIPALSYLHSNMISITRSSQPMAGIKQNRSVQDEKLVECIFSSDQINPSPYVNLSHNVIMDARPMANVIAQTAMGSGAESSENYKGCRIMFLGIENIHIVRDSRNRLFDAIQGAESRPVSKSSLDRSGWLRHVRTIIDGASLIVQNVDIHKNHVLVHCSDGWDRTAQLCSLASMCLDPYYRTLEGFCVLIEKEWISFGHKFSDRLGIISRENNDSSERPQTMGQQLHAQSKLFSSSISSAAKSLFKHANDSAPSLSTHSSSMPNKLMPREVSPVFTQFLDCCYQIWRQFPTQFEYSDKLFLALNDHIYSCQFGTFLFNNERERLMYRSGQNQLPIQDVAFSIWDWILSNPTEFLNPAYVPCASEPAFVAEVGTMHSSISSATSGKRSDGERGTHGCTSPDGRVLYPGGINPVYWMDLLRRPEDEDFNDTASVYSSMNALDEKKGSSSPGYLSEDGADNPASRSPETSQAEYKLGSFKDGSEFGSLEAQTSSLPPLPLMAELRVSSHTPPPSALGLEERDDVATFAEPRATIELPLTESGCTVNDPAHPKKSPEADLKRRLDDELSPPSVTNQVSLRTHSSTAFSSSTATDVNALDEQQPDLFQNAKLPEAFVAAAHDPPEDHAKPPQIALDIDPLMGLPI